MLLIHAVTRLNTPISVLSEPIFCNILQFMLPIRFHQTTNQTIQSAMTHYNYHYPTNDGVTIDFNEPSNLEEYDKLVSDGIPPLALVLIIFSKSIELPDGSRHKVFSRWTKERFRSLLQQYDKEFIFAECRNLLLEYWAGYDFTNPIGLLIHRITRNATQKSPVL